ncbi:MAG: helix-turn-helix domain-containing protein [Microcoleaceae cyanobacterium]
MTFSTTVNCDSTPAFGISQEQLQAVLRQIEVELYRSKVYRIAQAHLRKKLGDSANKGDILIRAIGREAIQLAVKTLVQQSRLATQTALVNQFYEAKSSVSIIDISVDVPPLSPPEFLNGEEIVTPQLILTESCPATVAPQIELTQNSFDHQHTLSEAPLITTAPEITLDSEHDASLNLIVQDTARLNQSEPMAQAATLISTETAITAQDPIEAVVLETVTPEAVTSAAETVAFKADTSEAVTPEAVIPAIFQPKPKQRKLTKADIAAQSLKHRANCLRQIGQELQQARQTLSLSLLQLHQRTLIPLSHLQALEMGQLDQLPGDIYVRGFIRRIGNTLGLDGAAMAAILPEPPLQPSWSKLEPEAGVQLNSMHLYLGYAAVLAGSLGGVAWLAQQSVPENSLPPDLPDLAPETSERSGRELESKNTPGLRSATDIVLGADIAPPEQMGINQMPQSLTTVGFSSYSLETGG